MIPALASHRNETGIKRMRGEGSSSEAREAVNRKSLHSNALCILFPYFLFFWSTATNRETDPPFQLKTAATACKLPVAARSTLRLTCSNSRPPPSDITHMNAVQLTFLDPLWPDPSAGPITSADLIRISLAVLAPSCRTLDTTRQWGSKRSLSLFHQPPLFTWLALAALVENKGLTRSMEAVVLTKQRQKEFAKLSMTLSSRCRPLLKLLMPRPLSAVSFWRWFKETVAKFLRTKGSIEGAQSADSFEYSLAEKTAQVLKKFGLLIGNKVANDRTVRRYQKIGNIGSSYFLIQKSSYGSTHVPSEKLDVVLQNLYLKN